MGTTRALPADSPADTLRGHAAAGGPAVRLAPAIIGAATLVLGAIAAIHHHALALAHFDARAHLVVARRILDSLTPGWQQIGAVWLPLPHVLNMLPVQIDAAYRTGASAIAISVIAMGVAAWALARLILAVTGSAFGAAAGAALLAANPNVLYLQSTPMTEPLLIATCLVALSCTAAWIDRGAPSPPRAAGWAIVAAAMTRYEAWPICAALLALIAIVLVRRGAAISVAVRGAGRLAVYPAIALLLFTLNSRWTIGTWFVPAGFYVPENEALGNAGLAFEQVRDTVYQLSGTAWVWPAYAAAALIALTAGRSARRAPILLVLALAAAVALPWYAYYRGHPVRVRYAVPLVAACAAITGTGIGLLWKPLRPIAAAAVVLWAVIQSPPLRQDTPLVAESQRDAANRSGRAAVTDYLRQHWDGTTIMMSMGSLAHYMHDLSQLGLGVRDFLQEGNEQLWVHAATEGPRGFVTWVVVEERAEGGDVLFQAAASNPQFLRGFDRVAEGGGIALYRAR